MRIYAQLEDVGSEYELIIPIKLSLTPLENDCYYIELLDEEVDIIINKWEDAGNWIPYNTIVQEAFWFNPEIDHGVLESSDEKIDDNYLDGFLCKEYKEGILTKTYFEDGYSGRIFPIKSCK